MKTISRILSCLFCALDAYGQSAEICPKLPSGAELKWSYSQGPDFDVCRAMRGARQVFGMYLGNHPSFRPDERQRAETGRIGEHEVAWYNVPSEDASRPISKQTLLRRGPKPDAAVAHVWLSAANIEELNQTLAILQQVSFK